MQNYTEINALKRNTLIIAIANIGSKAIAFLLAPIYSYFLTPSQYGITDLITTSVSLLLPILCLDIYEATFRYTSDKNYSETKVVSSSLFILIIETIFLILGSLVLKYLCSIPDYLFVVLVCVELDSIFQVLTQYVRGKNLMKEYAYSGVVFSIVLLIANLILLVLMQKELTGWIMSFLAAKFIACFYIVYISKFWHFFSLKDISKDYLREAFQYCLPLLPNTIMWWVMNLSDRFLITFYIGIAGTGIYAVASKIPSILGIFENIFFQSWQTSAINTVEDNNKEDFYSFIFEKYLIFLSLGIITVLTILKPVIHFFSEEYESAWISSGILVVSVIFHALGGNLGALYAAFKTTKGAFYTSLCGALTNLSLNILLIPLWGLTAAALTTMIGYFVVLLMRWIDIKKYVHLKIKIETVCVCSFLVITQTTAYYLDNMFSYPFFIIVLLTGLFFYKKEIKGLVSAVIK